MSDELKELVLQSAKDGKIVFVTVEGPMQADLEDFIKQPTEGLLYDLNRDKATVLTLIDDKKWVNDYAVSMVIEKLKNELELMRQKCIDDENLADGYFDLLMQAQETKKGLVDELTAMTAERDRLLAKSFQETSDYEQYKELYQQQRAINYDALRRLEKAEAVCEAFGKYLDCPDNTIDEATELHNASMSYTTWREASKHD